MAITDEFDFIKKITPKETHHPDLVKGIGDDAALFRGNNEVEEIVCMDTMVEGIHFNSQTMCPYHVGYKVLAANISDVAAMGGTPTFYLVSISIPPNWTEGDLVQLYKGMDDLAKQYEVELIGGDTTSSNKDLVITVTALGRVPKGVHLLRSNSRTGDIVFVTGTIGDSAAGLELLLNYGVDYPYSSLDRQLVHKHQLPTPRVDVAQMLTAYGRVALDDISDGLASEANEIAEASGVSLVIDKGDVPVSEGVKQAKEEKQLEWVLNGGEDFELVGTMPKEDWEKFSNACIERGIKVTKIGVVEDGESSVFLRDKSSKTLITKNGYNHFKK